MSLGNTLANTRPTHLFTTRLMATSLGRVREPSTISDGLAFYFASLTRIGAILVAINLNFSRR